jgi:hypothetical protein
MQLHELVKKILDFSKKHPVIKIIIALTIFIIFITILSGNIIQINNSYAKVFLFIFFIIMLLIDIFFL